MGVFDYVRVLYPLPEGAPGPDAGWQTKDTEEQYLRTYEIREDGSLWYLPRIAMTKEGAPPQPEGDFLALIDWRRDWIDWVDGEPERQCITGAVTFYTFTDDPQKTWWEFVALYDEGSLISLREVDTPNTRRAESGGADG